MSTEDIKTENSESEISKSENKTTDEKKDENNKEKKEQTPKDLYKDLLLIIKKFLSEHIVYEAIPGNMKILIFNSELNILETIYAMVKEDIYCSLVYDSLYKNFIGIITIRDIMELIKFINDKIKKYNGTIVNTNFFIKEIFSKNEVQLNSLSSIKESSELKPTSKKSFGSFDRINELDEEGSDSSFEGEIKEKPQSSSLKQGVDFFKSLNLISINDFYRTVKGIPIHRLISKAKLISVSLDNNLFDCAKLIKEKKTHRIIIEETKEKLGEVKPESNSNLLRIKNSNFIKNYTGFITYETMFDFFIQNYYGDMKEFNVLLNDIINISTISNKLTYKFDKNEKVFVVFEECFLRKLSIMPIYDKSNNEIFGYLFLKDLVYFFMKVGIFFTLDDSVEKFLNQLYEGIDDEKPLGKERIKYINIKKEKYTMKQIFELLNASPEKKIIINTGDDYSLITLSNIFKSVINIQE